MAEEQHHASNPDLERLQEKTRKGARNVVTDVLNDPVVQGMIKKSILREATVSGLIMACLFLGLFKLYDVAKIVFRFDWTIDLVMGLVLSVASLGYMLKNFRQKQP